MSATLLDEVRSGTAPPLVPITVKQYHLMIRDGILQDGDPIELIDGMLVRKDRSARGDNLLTHNPRHALLIKRLQRLLNAHSEAGGWHLQIQLPVTLYWLVNLPESQVEVYEQPDAESGKYTRQTILKPTQILTWNSSPTECLEINVADLFR